MKKSRKRLLTFQEFVDSDIAHSYTFDGERGIAKEANEMEIEEAKKAFISKKTNVGRAIFAHSLLGKKRNSFNSSDDLFLEIAELLLYSKALNYEESQKYTTQSLREFWKQSDRQKTFKDFTDEIEITSKNSVNEGLKTKGVLAGLYMRYRSRLKDTNQSVEEKFKILADLIGVVGMFNFDAVRDAVKEISKESK